MRTERLFDRGTHGHTREWSGDTRLLPNKKALNETNEYILEVQDDRTKDKYSTCKRCRAAAAAAVARKYDHADDHAP